MRLHTSDTFDIVQSERGVIGLIIFEVLEPQNYSARMVYDGGDTLLMFRSDVQPVVFGNISPFARRPLMEANYIFIVEFDEGIKRYGYVAPVIKVNDVKPYMCMLGDGWIDDSIESAAIISIFEDKMKKDEEEYYADKQKQTNRLIDQLIKHVTNHKNK